jgi:hypothetical protein
MIALCASVMLTLVRASALRSIVAPGAEPKAPAVAVDGLSGRAAGYAQEEAGAGAGPLG